MQRCCTMLNLRHGWQIDHVLALGKYISNIWQTNCVYKQYIIIYTQVIDKLTLKKTQTSAITYTLRVNLYLPMDAIICLVFRLISTRIRWNTS